MWNPPSPMGYPHLPIRTLLSLRLAYYSASQASVKSDGSWVRATQIFSNLFGVTMWVFPTVCRREGLGDRNTISTSLVFS